MQNYGKSPKKETRNNLKDNLKQGKLVKYIFLIIHFIPICKIKSEQKVSKNKSINKYVKLIHKKS